MLNEGEGHSLIIDNIKSLPEQRLTKREFQIVLLFIDGWNQTDICKKLKIKEKTLYCHTSSALGKMGVRKMSHIMMSSKPY
ncbi:hypothetical protein ACO03_11900 [Pantoea ananatis]|nr:hypothetical protein ACO03_11900 [Pantoea ananatis]